MNNTIWAQVVEIEKKNFRKEISLSLKRFILHPMNYNTSRVFTVVFTVVFTARSLRVHRAFTARSLQPSPGRPRPTMGAAWCDSRGMVGAESTISGAGLRLP